MSFSSSSRSGFTLVESLIGAAILLVVSVSVYNGWSKLLELSQLSKLKITAAALANEQFEIARNLPFADVGIQGGLPAGKIPHIQTLTRNGVTFTVTSTVRNVDDPFDGTIGGTPNDLSPADYRLMEVEITCPTCKNFQPVIVTSSVGPKGLETASTNGALFVKVFDAAGQPLSGAAVHIENTDANPDIIIDDVTNAAGLLQIVDAPPGVGAYSIRVSKSGYSTEQTYVLGGVGNPNPSKPHATVAVQQVTQLSFAIDKVSTLNVASVRDTCAPVGAVDFSLKGSKLIGTSPDVYKYDTAHVTDASGLKTISSLEWDTYTTTLTSTGYDLVGSIPLNPLTVNPDTTQDFKLIVAPKNPSTLLVTVKDTATQLPISGAEVTISKAGFTSTLSTGRGFLTQTDWKAGAGQVNFVDADRYFDSDTNVETTYFAGEIRLKDMFGTYASSGYLISSSFDTGSASNFHQILFKPESQPAQTGANAVRFQVATNNDNTTWNFLGPDGTASTYYTSSNNNLNSLHNGDRYFRYKVFLSTADTAYTPTVSDVSFTFTSSCVPPGQTAFSGLSQGLYDVSITKTGYQVFTDQVNLGSVWQQYEASLAP